MTITRQPSRVCFILHSRLKMTSAVISTPHTLPGHLVSLIAAARPTPALVVKTSAGGSASPPGGRHPTPVATSASVTHASACPLHIDTPRYHHSKAYLSRSAQLVAIWLHEKQKKRLPGNLDLSPPPSFHNPRPCSMAVTKDITIPEIPKREGVDPEWNMDLDALDLHIPHPTIDVS